MAKCLIVDGNSIANRAFYALPFLTNHEGKASGALFGFANQEKKQGLGQVTRFKIKRFKLENPQ